jgi:hypothetical protein
MNVWTTHRMSNTRIRVIDVSLIRQTRGFGSRTRTDTEGRDGQ